MGRKGVKMEVSFEVERKEKWLCSSLIFLENSRISGLWKGNGNED